jgi:hypothetical protein
MPAKLKIIGLPELNAALEEIAERLEDKSLITKPLAEGMERVVHEITGHLKSTIKYNDTIAYADADYAGYEADRGDQLAGGKTGHDFGQRAIDDFDVDKWADEIVEPF